MKGYANPDGWVRLDFPGGWSGDKVNAFTGAGLSDTALQVQQLIKTLANFRKTSPALTRGKMMQYIPVDGLYVYFRYTDTQTIMCIINTSNGEKGVNFTNYPEQTTGFSGGKNVITGENVSSSFTIPAMQMWVVELKK